MSVNYFFKSFNAAHKSFAASKGEQFEVVGVGTIDAIEIAQLSSEQLVSMGGKVGDNAVVVHVSKEHADKVKQGVKIVVRGKRCRIASINDSGDNRLTLIADAAGVTI